MAFCAATSRISSPLAEMLRISTDSFQPANSTLNMVKSAHPTGRNPETQQWRDPTDLTKLRITLSLCILKNDYLFKNMSHDVENLFICLKSSFSDFKIFKKFVQNFQNFKKILKNLEILG